jgi:hypothetical protein
MRIVEASLVGFAKWLPLLDSIRTLFGFPNDELRHRGMPVGEFMPIA